MTGKTDALELLADSSDHAVARSNGVIMYRLWRTPSVAVLRAVQGAQRSETARLGMRTVNVSFIEPECSLDWDEEARRVASEQLREAHEVMLCQALVLLKPGFLAAVSRSVISSIYRVGRHQVPVMTVGRLEDAARWIADHARGGGLPLAEAELLAAATEFRQRPRPTR